MIMISTLALVAEVLTMMSEKEESTRVDHHRTRILEDHRMLEEQP